METALDTMIQEIEKRGGYVENKQKRENDKEYRQRMMLINTIVTELFVGDRETLVKMSNPDHP
jgi:deoxyadenosine/deoxycytidine kinase